jgi:hypothetical protein
MLPRLTTNSAEPADRIDGYGDAHRYVGNSNRAGKNELKPPSS